MPEDLPLEIRAQGRPGADGPAAEPQHWLGGMSLDDVERLAIEQTLVHCRGNKAEAARTLRISEKSIYNKMKRLGLNGHPRPSL